LPFLQRRGILKVDGRRDSRRNLTLVMSRGGAGSGTHPDEVGEEGGREMRERILVPLDGSEVGESALPYVKDLLTKMSFQVEREVILLQVVIPIRVMLTETVVPDAAAEEAMTEQSKRIASEYLERVRQAWDLKGVTVTPTVVVGRPAEQIVKAAEDMNVDLIAMSTHGRSGLGRLAFGSITHKVLHWQGRVPIVVIRAAPSK